MDLKRGNEMDNHFEDNKELMSKLDESFREIRSIINTYWGKYSISGLGITHARMMTHLSENGPTKASHIADRLYITCGAVTGLSDRLLELGFVTREKDIHDRRVVLLKLSEDGEKHVEQIKAVRKNLMIHLFEGLTSEEMESSIYLFEKMKQNMIIFNSTDKE